MRQGLEVSAKPLGSPRGELAAGFARRLKGETRERAVYRPLTLPPPSGAPPLKGRQGAWQKLQVIAMPLASPSGELARSHNGAPARHTCRVGRRRRRVVFEPCRLRRGETYNACADERRVLTYCRVCRRDGGRDMSAWVVSVSPSVSSADSPLVRGGRWPGKSLKPPPSPQASPVQGEAWEVETSSYCRPPRLPRGGNWRRAPRGD